MRIFSLPLRYMIPLLLLTAGLLFSTYLFFYETHLSYRNVENTVREQARTIGLLASSEIEASLRGQNPSHAQDILNHLSTFENVKEVFIFGPDLKARFAYDHLLEQKPLEKTLFNEYREIISKAQNDMKGRSFLSADNESVIAVFPFTDINIAKRGFDHAGLLCFRIELEEKKAVAFEKAFLRSLISIIIFVLISLVIWLIVHFHVLSRVNMLINFTRGIAEGHFRLLDIEENNEIGVLAHELNEMSRRIEHTTHDLRRSSERLTDAQRIGKMGDWRLDVITQEFTWSGQVYNLLGYPTQSITVSLDDYLSLCPEAERGRVRETFLDALSGKTSMDIEHRISRADGQEIWVHLRSEKAGALSHLSGTLSDITDRRRAEEALRASEEKYRKLFQDVRDVVYFSSVDGDILEINKAGLELFGYANLEEMQNISVSDDMYLDKQDRIKFTEEINKKGSVKDYELTLKTKHGEPLHVLISSNVVRNSRGEVSGYRGIIRDVTKQKQLQHELLQSQKMEAIGTLAGGIAHDFNNILGAIVGYSEILRIDLEKDPKSIVYVEQIYKAGLRAKDLVNQILTFSRKREPEIKEVIFAEIVREASKFLRATLPTTIHIETDINDVNGVVLADETQLHQLIMNLSTNAYHAMKDEGDGVLTLSLDNVNSVDEEDGNGTDQRYLKLSIRDNGRGMDDKTLVKIFDPFFTTKPIGEGTGMGLSVVHGIVKSHGGYIRVESEPGEGSCFSVYLPCVDNVEYIPDKAELNAPTGQGRILIVDDESDLLYIEKDMLEYLGYDVQAVDDPLLAEDIFRRDPSAFDLIMSDLTMPHMDGATLIAKIRQIDDSIPIILMTGYTDLQRLDKMNDLKIFSVLRKPLTMYEMAKAVKAVMKNSKV